MKNALRPFVTIPLVFAACANSPAPAPEAPAPAEPPQSGPDLRPDASETPSRAQLTAEDCEAKRGTVVGDIGDGAIHRPDYTCPSGAAPIGSIIAAAGEPQSVEGAVCCPQ